MRKEIEPLQQTLFSNFYIFGTRRFQTINSVRFNSLSLKYQRCTPSGCKDIVIGKFQLVVKTQFLYVEGLMIYH